MVRNICRWCVQMAGKGKGNKTRKGKRVTGTDQRPKELQKKNM